MNYRHGYHAGNFADVVKHAVLALIVRHLTLKPAPFRYIDTHAGLGAYDLLAEEANKTGEWRGGIGRVWNAPLDPAVAKILEPWRHAVESLNPDGRLRFYPGSPDVVRALSRPDDRLVLCELHPQDARQMRQRYARDRRVRAIEIDGWTALNAYVPPKERRGLVLIDPPFEEKNELGRMAQALVRGHRKWPGGTYVLWYPIKDPLETDSFTRALGKEGIPSILGAELLIQRPNDSSRLNGTGLAIVNPPFTLEKDLGVLLPALSGLLGRDTHARSRIFQISAEE